MIFRFLRRFFMVAGFFSVGLPLLMALFSQLYSEKLPTHHVIYAQLDGPLAERIQPKLGAMLLGTPQLSLWSFIETLEQAAKDPKVAGLLLHVRDPELGLAQAQEVGEAIAAFRASGKWLTAFLEPGERAPSQDLAYSLAAQAGHVLLHASSHFDLSGMHADLGFFKETLHRLHVTPYVEARREFKNGPNTFTEQGLTAEHRLAIKSLFDDLQRIFVTNLAARRNQSPEQIRSAFAQTPLFAPQAAQLGLVDGVAYYDEVLQQALAALRAAGGKVESDEDTDWLVDLEDYARLRGAHSAPFGRSPGGKNTAAVAVIVGSGEIKQRASSLDSLDEAEVMDAETISEAFSQARQDGVAGVIFRVSSPGGSFTASDVIRREVQLTRERGIPVVISMGNYAASGGYMASLDADHIIAQPTSITGSIGVYAVMFPLRRALGHFLGVSFDSYAALEKPFDLSWLDPPSPAARAHFGKQIDFLYDYFVAQVGRARGRSPEQVEAAAKGRVWSGEQALALGLVDELGGLSAARAFLQKRLTAEGEGATPPALHLSFYPAPEGPFELLRKAFAHPGRHSLGALLSYARAAVADLRATYLGSGPRYRAALPLPLATP